MLQFTIKNFAATSFTYSQKTPRHGRRRISEAGGVTERTRARAQKGNNFLCAGQMSTLFSCYVHRKGVLGSRVRAPGQRPPEAKTLLAVGRAMEAANLSAF